MLANLYITINHIQIPNTYLNCPARQINILQSRAVRPFTIKKIIFKFKDGKPGNEVEENHFVPF